MCAHFFGFCDHFCHVQKGLRRNAADVQADTAKRRILFNQDNLLAKVRCAERSSVATWAGAQNHNFGMNVTRSGGCSGGSNRSWRCRRWCFLRGLCWRIACIRTFKHHDYRTFGDFVTFANLDLFDHTGRWRWDFHRGLIGFQFDQWVFFGHSVAHADQNRNDGNVCEIPNIGYFDIHQVVPLTTSTCAYRQAAS